MKINKVKYFPATDSNLATFVLMTPKYLKFFLPQLTTVFFHKLNHVLEIYSI